jgi:hypothetical protein
MAAAAVSSWVPEQHLLARLGLPPSGSAPAHQPKAAPSHEATTSLSEDSSTADATTQPDPHHLPTFDSTTLTAPTAPILYLPPLLSSLPSGYSHSVDLVGNHRPLTTDTRLPDIDPVSLMLHKALHKFQPVTSEYSVIPYEQAFNWKDLVLPEDAEREWYCVVFRSKRKEGSDGGRKLHLTSYSTYNPYLS